MFNEQMEFLSENEKLAMNIAGESTSRIMTLDGKTADDVIRERNIQSFNNQVDDYVEKLNKHATSLEEHTQRIADRINDIEIMPIGNYLLVKEFADNPFQRIVRSDSGLILDLGGQKPQYKNTDNGNVEEEENFIKVAVIQAVGPECKWCQEGDTVFATKVSLVPVPFYKQGLSLLCENRVLAVVNEGLEKRFNEIKNGK